MENSSSDISKLVVNKMIENDYFSKWLGIELISISEGNCQLKFKVTKEMLNGFHSIHGGILFSVADSAFAFACNSHGKEINVALDCTISYARPAFENEILMVSAKEINRGKTTGIYEVEILNEKNKLVAKFKGISYKTQNEHSL